MPRALLACFLAAACSSEDVNADLQPCGPNGACPTGYSCEADSKCHKAGVVSAARFAYVTSSGTSEIWRFQVGGDGGLTKLGAPVSTVADPRHLVVDPSGKYLLVAGFGANLLASFAIDSATGALTPVNTAAAGVNPI